MNGVMKRGLSALLEDIEDMREDEISGKIYDIPLYKIQPNPDQPRKTFNEDGLSELTESIKEHGIIQPIVAKKEGNAYTIIAGERRYRAAKAAGLFEVPVILKDYDEARIKEVSLIENIQRENLNPIEESEAIRNLMIAYGLTQEEVSKKIGKARSSIANSLRLLNLTDEVKEFVKQGLLSAGHARSLLGIDDEKEQIEVAKRAIEEGWSVRDVETEVKYFLNPELRPKISPKACSHETEMLLNDLSEVLSAKVKLIGNETKGRISIEFSDHEEFTRICKFIAGDYFCK